MDRVSDRSKGFGFVTYASEEEAEKAIAEMNGKVGPCPSYFFFIFPHTTLTLQILIGGAAT